jgi:hypothetical protein
MDELWIVIALVANAVCELFVHAYRVGKYKEVEGKLI